MKFRIYLRVFCEISLKSRSQRSFFHTRSAFISSVWKMPERRPFERLPQNVLPVNYALQFKPDLTNFTFAGSEDISVQVKNPTKEIRINSAEIDITSVQFSSSQQTVTENIGVAYNVEDELVTLTFPEELQVGDANLKIAFNGILNDKMKGFYRSKYKTPDGQDRYGGVTQFEPTDARRAFPCWDEPAIKATFDVTLTVPEDRVVLSNMTVKTESAASDAGWKVVSFNRSPIMSTYLLAFVVGEYDFVEDTDADGVKVRVYTPVGKKDQGTFALEVAVKTLPFYRQYFNIAYPLPKIDLIAIADFAAGAMENWGLVTYRETALLIDKENSSSATRQYVALVVGHELAHQWFGNLVTMEWWTHLWLNEGFASWIEYLCVDHCFPQYDIWTQFATSDFTRALELDALRNSHPIEVAVGHPSEVDEIFDAISYSKGASVIRMLHDYIGDEDYRKGMNSYLTKHQYNNTFTEDLWEALGSASGKPVNKIMSTWTKQMGYPVLKVSQEVNGTTRMLKIQQEKFCADGKQVEGSEKQLWLVPVSITTASSPDKAVHRFVLDQHEVAISLENINPSDWVKLNLGGIGFYRTQYSSDMFDAILPGVSSKALPPRDRLGLQNDVFALARAGVLSTVDFLKLAQAFANETDYTVWSDLCAGLGSVWNLIEYTDKESSFKTFLIKLFSTIASKLGWDSHEGESPLDAMLRGLVLKHLGMCDDDATLAQARQRFNSHINGHHIAADLRSPVYSTVLKHGGEEEYEKLLTLFRATDLQEEKVRILRCLGAATQKELILRTLAFSLSSEVRSNETVFVVAGCTGSKEGRELAWNFLQTNWATLYERYQGGFILGRLIKVCTEGFASEERADEVQKFFAAHSAPSAERNIDQAVENIRLNAQQLTRDQAHLDSFLTNTSSL